MSMAIMVQAMKVKVGNPLRKLVLLKLADNASDLGECWPSYQHIADQCEISKRSVISHIEALCKSGLLKKELRKGPNGNASNVYYIRLDSAGASLPSAGASLPSAGASLPSAGASPGGGAGDAPRISHSFESVNEPKKNSQPDKQSDDLPDKTENKKPKQPHIEYRAFFDAYNEILGDRLPWAKDITDQRKSALKRLLPKLKTPTVEGFRAYLSAFSTRAKSFYFGDNDRRWRANIDFLLREKTLVGVREGTVFESTEETE
ncbi:helix-turn-helix domain-containing protein [Salmonella enterica]|nr:helix-turn-helix domain-containing protein [Salmonella enterica]